MDDTGIRPVRSEARCGPARWCAGTAVAGAGRGRRGGPGRTPTAAAFFDVDNTVMRGASIFVLARGLWRRDFFGAPRHRRDGLEAGPVHRRRREPRARRPDPRAGAGLRGRALGRRADRHRRGGLRRADGRQDLAGHPRPGAAAPGRRAAGLAGDRHPGRGGAGHRPAARPDRRPRHGGRERRRRLHRPAGRRAAARPGQGRRRSRRWPSARAWTCRRCSAYSDSANDIPMLSLVGHPCAVNPDAALREHARARGWQIVDYRRGRKAAKLGLGPRRRPRSPARWPPSARRRRS